MENEFKMPDYYNTSKPKAEEKLVKRKCFRCGKEKEIGVLKDTVVQNVEQ